MKIDEIEGVVFLLYTIAFDKVLMVLLLCSILSILSAIYFFLLRGNMKWGVCSLGLAIVAGIGYIGLPKPEFEVIPAASSQPDIYDGPRWHDDEDGKNPYRKT